MAIQPNAGKSRNPVAALLIDAVATVVVVLVLTFPIVALRTVDLGGHLGIETHYGLSVTIAVVLGALRFLQQVIARQLRLRKVRGEKAASAISAPTKRGHQSRVPVYIGAVGLIAALIVPVFGNNYITDFGTTVLIYVMLGWGLNIVVGLAGLLDLGYVGFYAVGAYSVGLLSTNFGFGFWECLPFAGLFAACFGIILGFPVLRLRGDYLAIVTMGFGEIIRVVLLNWSNVTNGPNGIGSIPRPTLFGLSFDRAGHGGMTFSHFFGIDWSPNHRIVFLYFVILLLALVTNFFTLRLRRLPIGRAWEALREDEIACRAIGINATNVKLSAFAMGAMFAGFAGSFFATRQGFISPESFTFTESAIILSIVVLGGMGSQLGVVLAALLLVVLQEAGRWNLLPAAFGDLSQYRMLIFGAAMVAIMVTRPRGLLSNRRPSLLLHRDGVVPPLPNPVAEVGR